MAGFCVEEIMKDNYVVYMHIAPSGKRYIGITMRDPARRWGYGCNYKSNEHFYNAIKKYGWDKIIHLVLFEGLTKEDACEKEQFLIHQYKTHDPRYGYNLTKGGEHYEFTDETIKKLHKPHRLTEEGRRKLSLAARKGYEKRLKGRRLTPEQIEKMATSKRGRKLSPEHCKALSEGQKAHWAAVGGFSEQHRANLSKALKGRTYNDETLARMKAAHAPDKNKRSKRVQQIKDGNIIAEFVSAREAMRQTGISYTSIVRVCNGVRLHQAGGYEWRYAK